MRERKYLCWTSQLDPMARVFMAYGALLIQWLEMDKTMYSKEV